MSNVRLEEINIIITNTIIITQQRCSLLLDLSLFDITD